MIDLSRDNLERYRTLWHSECIENKLSDSSGFLIMDVSRSLANLDSSMAWMSISEPYVGAFFTVIAAITGAGIAGFFSFLATKKAHEFNIEKADRDQRAITSNTLALIMIEIKAAWGVYVDEYAVDLKSIESGKPYVVMFPIGVNTFSLYDSSPSCLANLPVEVAEKIVLIYMRMKGMIAMIELNNNDARQAFNAAESRMQALYNEATMSGKELSNEALEAIYKNYVDYEAAKLGMGNTADGMKLLGADIECLYASLLEIAPSYQQASSK